MNNTRKLALVTGANRGIGLEVVRQLAKAGVEVILTSRNKAKGVEAQQQLKDEGLEVHYCPLAVDDPHSVDMLKKEVTDTYGKLDVLVNNAGVLLDRGIDLVRLDHKSFETTMHTNVFGPYYLCHAFIPLMEANGYGRVVNISSGYGKLDQLDSPDTASYKLSKNALNAMTRLLASSVDHRKVKVNAASPGWVHTDMGGPEAPRSPETAAQGIVWLAMLPEDGPSGKFFYDKEEMEW